MVIFVYVEDKKVKDLAKVSTKVTQPRMHVLTKARVLYSMAHSDHLNHSASPSSLVDRLLVQIFVSIKAEKKQRA